MSAVVFRAPHLSAGALLGASSAWSAVDDDIELQKKLANPVIRPDQASDWFVRFQVNFIFSK